MPLSARSARKTINTTSAKAINTTSPTCQATSGPNPVANVHRAGSSYGGQAAWRGPGGTCGIDGWGTLAPSPDTEDTNRARCDTPLIHGMAQDGFGDVQMSVNCLPKHSAWLQSLQVAVPINQWAVANQNCRSLVGLYHDVNDMKQAEKQGRCHWRMTRWAMFLGCASFSGPQRSPQA
jgi:hypothetical protein